MSESPQDIVARHLSSSLRGYPLWTPDPPRELLIHRPEGLRIGDVGVVVPGVGCFDVCFNICLPPNHPFHQVTRVPDNFEPIELSEEDIRTNINMEPRDKVITGKLSSVQFLGIGKQPKDGSTRIKSSGLEYQFNLSSHEGAILILPEGADLVDLRNPDAFREAARQHGADWYRFAKKKLGQTLAPDSLYLITGLYKTRTWSLAAFDKIEETMEYPALFRNSPNIRRWETTRPLEWGIGPIDNYGPPNQAVFIRGFKIAFRSEMFGIRKWIDVTVDDPSMERNPVNSYGVAGSFVNYILGGNSAVQTSASAGNGMQDDGATSSMDSGREHAVDEHVVIQRVPEVSQPFHLSDVVNKYLLNKELSANIAVTHDDDWMTMLQENQLQPEDLAQNGRLETLISQQYEITLNEGAIYLQRQSDSGSASGSQSRRVQSNSNKNTYSAEGVPGMHISSSTGGLFLEPSSGQDAATHIVDDSPISIFSTPSANTPTVFPEMYTSLASFTFGNPHPSSVSTRDAFLHGSGSDAMSGSDDERSEDSSPYIDPVIPALLSGRHHGGVMSDDASQHTYDSASRTHRPVIRGSRDGEAPLPSSVPISQGSVLTVGDLVQSLDDLSTRRSSHSGEGSLIKHRARKACDSCRCLKLRCEPSEYGLNERPCRRCILRGLECSLSRDARSESPSSPLGVQGPSLLRSRPRSRADTGSWLSLTEAQQQLAQPNVLEGIDLEYVLSKRSEGSMRSFGSRPSFLQSPSAPRWSSSCPSVIVQNSASSSAIEDTFLRHFQKYDRAFSALRSSWSFQRESRDEVDAPSSHQRQQVRRSDKSGKRMPLEVQEIWGCARVGRFKVDGPLIDPQSAQPAKGAQQFYIHHIPNPSLDTVWVPHSVIHKHSKDAVFSIFRSHALFSGHRLGGAGSSNTWLHTNMRLGIFLASKKAQEQYTNTQTTRLNHHGLLDNESQRSLPDSDSRSFALRERDPRDKGWEWRQGSETGFVGRGKRYPLHKAGSPTKGTTDSAPKPPSVKIKVPSTISSLTTTSRPGSPPSLLALSSSDSVNLPKISPVSMLPIRHDRDSVDSDNPRHPRATHAEAFSALYPNDIEYLRTMPSNRANAGSGSTISAIARLSRFFRSSRKGNEGHSPFSAEPSAFQPPWMITASRDRQERVDRISNVLLRKKRHKKPSESAPKRESNPSVLNQIPEDSLYMLLPLWPGETDKPITPVDTNLASFVTTPENRRYLLVYYVPFGEPKEAITKDKKFGKRMKHFRSSDNVAKDAKTIHLSAFRVVARVVTYDELRLTGVHLPGDGLAINDFEQEANRSPAPAAPGDAQAMDIVVCQCFGRERGCDFFDEALLRLGLCTQEDILPDTVSESGESATVLTPIGKAVVEMIWLGCLAVTSFSST